MPMILPLPAAASGLLIVMVALLITGCAQSPYAGTGDAPGIISFELDGDPVTFTNYEVTGSASSGSSDGGPDRISLRGEDETGNRVSISSSESLPCEILDFVDLSGAHWSEDGQCEIEVSINGGWHHVWGGTFSGVLAPIDSGAAGERAISDGFFRVVPE